MHWFENLSLRGKLLAAFAPVVVVVLVRTVLAYGAMQEYRDAGEMVNHTILVIDRAEVARTDIIQAVAAQRAYLLTGDPDERLTYTRELADAENALASLKVLTSDNPEQSARWEAIGAALETWTTQTGDPGLALRDAVATGTASQTELMAPAGPSGNAQLDEIAGLFDQAIAVEQGHLADRTDMLADADRRAGIYFVAGAIVALVLAVVAAGLLIRDLTGAVGRLLRASQRLADGDLSERLRFRRRDEIGRTAVAFDLMADRLQGTVRDLETSASAARQREEQFRSLFVEADRQARELALLDAIRTALAREIELPVIFRTVVDATRQVLGYSHVSVYSLDDDELVLQYQIGYDRVIERVPIDQGIVGRVVRTGRPVLLEECRSDASFMAAIDGITSEICVPLRDRDRIVGVFNVETVDERRLGAADLEIIETVGHQLAIAIERARLFAAARDGEARFRALIQNASDAIGIVGLDGMIVYASPAAERILGYTPEELIGTRGDLLHPDDAPDVLQVARELRGSPGRHVEFSTRMRHKDGRYRNIELVATNLSDEPAVGGVVYNYRDVTERVVAEAERERQYAAVDRASAEADATLDAAGEAMVLVTPEGLVARVNRRFLEFFDATWAEVAGRRIHHFRERTDELFEDPGRFVSLIDAALLDGKIGRTDLLVQAWPERRELEVTTTAVAGAAGELLGHLFAFRDVTHQRAIDRMKTEFVSLASHELRTPLTSIRGYVDLLLEGAVGDLEDDQRAFLEIVSGNARRLVNLINDLLDISRIESGRVTLNRTAVDLGVAIRDVAAGLRPALDGRKQLLTIEIEDGLPTVDGDPDRLAQVIANLLSNANKYAAIGGRIRISLERDGSSLCLAVQDDGVGISDEDQAQLFTKFFRARNRATEEAGGTGLGLAITRSLVELHGGAIGVESEPGVGSTFTVVLPIMSDADDSAPGGRIGRSDDASLNAIDSLEEPSGIRVNGTERSRADYTPRQLGVVALARGFGQ